CKSNLKSAMSQFASFVGQVANLPFDVVAFCDRLATCPRNPESCASRRPVPLHTIALIEQTMEGQVRVPCTWGIRDGRNRALAAFACPCVRASRVPPQAALRRQDGSATGAHAR